MANPKPNPKPNPNPNQRGCSKATLRALEPSKAAHAQTRWALHCATGSLSFLAQLSAQARDAAGEITSRGRGRGLG